MIAPWPVYEEAQIDPAADKDMEFLQNVISAIRAVRSEMNLAPAKEVDVVLNCHEETRMDVLESNRHPLERMAKINSLMIGTNLSKPGYSASSVVQGQEIFIPLKGLIDINVERGRLEKEIARLEGQLQNVEAKLDNPNFADKAPADVVQKEKDKRDNFRHTILKLKSSLAQIQE
jgi:valyl-tRNA synthetase